MKEIPKKIHYCWFGGNPLSELAIKCIDSWKKYFPDYEIVRWDEHNFDVNSCIYIKEAYQAQKWAFVSDYARFVILYENGGIYFDTDVEVIKSMDDLIEKGAFMGRETTEVVAPGLGMAAYPQMKLYKEIIDYYKQSHFIRNDGEYELEDTVVKKTTSVLKQHGLKITDEIQLIDDIYIYPVDYFAPKDVLTKKLTITNNTRSIHHYDASWAEWYDKRAGERGIILRKYFGQSLGDKINIIIYVFQKYGGIGCLKRLISRS